jgi:hypothetical protein
MTESFAMFVAVTAYKTTWFLGQAIVFYALWNLAVAGYLDLDSLGIFQAIMIYAALRMIVEPPKLSVEIN